MSVTVTFHTLHRHEELFWDSTIPSRWKKHSSTSNHRHYGYATYDSSCDSVLILPVLTKASIYSFSGACEGERIISAFSSYDIRCEVG